MRTSSRVPPFHFLPMRRLWLDKQIEANVCSINTIRATFHLMGFFIYIFSDKKSIFLCSVEWCITIVKKSKTTQYSQPPIKTIMHIWVIHSSSHTVQPRWKQVRSDDKVRSRTQSENPKIKHKIILFVFLSSYFPFYLCPNLHTKTLLEFYRTASHSDQKMNTELNPHRLHNWNWRIVSHIRREVQRHPSNAFIFYF